MISKKDPGKFTVRFNIGDPRQREVVEVLSKQGRYKAQFLTDATLHYIHRTLESEDRVAGAPNSEEIRRIVCEILSEQQSFPWQMPMPAEEPVEPLRSNFEESLSETERDAIFRTMRDFQRG